MRILIADDTEAIHEVYRCILNPVESPVINLDAMAKFAPNFEELPKRQLCHELTLVYQGQDAVAAVNAASQAGTPFDLAILDVRMPPGITGVAAALKIRERYPELPIIICTAYADFTWADLAERFNHGVTILRKPFDAIELSTMVDFFNEKAALLRELRHLRGEGKA
jgi:CheY-like chemotaxis protein